MTKEDQVYADWLDLLGSGTAGGPALTEALERLHDQAEISHHGPGCTGGPGHTGSCPTLARPEEL
jgi:hypothetical protein